MATKKGKCHICGKFTDLTYEHVPPEKAFNAHKAFMHFGMDALGKNDEWPWDFNKSKGRQLQRGVGFYTLCGKCNNDTGGWYGRAFVDFIYNGYLNLKEKRKVRSNEWLTLTFPDIYPLRVIKQVITMFFSINSVGLSTVHPDLQKFILDKKQKGLEIKNYGLYLYVLKGNISRYIGIAGMLNINNHENRLLSELSAPPFGYVLEINPKHGGEYCDIAFFANQFDYNDRKTIRLDIPVYESNTPFPADYRTKQQVMNDYIKSKLDELQKKSKQ